MGRFQLSWTLILTNRSSKRIRAKNIYLSGNNFLTATLICMYFFLSNISKIPDSALVYVTV